MLLCGLSCFFNPSTLPPLANACRFYCPRRHCLQHGGIWGPGICVPSSWSAGGLPLWSLLLLVAGGWACVLAGLGRMAAGSREALFRREGRELRNLPAACLCWE